MTTEPAHRWRFFRAGGFDQVKLSSGADLASLGALDQKLWVALACPTKGIAIDPRTMALIDTDKDGRIRVPELLAAVRLACGSLKDVDDLVKGAGELSLDAIDDRTPEGKTLLGAARQVLRNLGRADATTIAVDAFAEPAKLFAETKLNGDGIIIAESADDEATRQLIGEIAASAGTATDRSGKPGIDQPRIDAFFAAARERDAWHRRGEAPADAAAAGAPGAVLFLGAERTAAAAAAVAAIRGKVDDYFMRCRVAAFDPRMAALVNRQEDDYRDAVAGPLDGAPAALAALPLAQAAAGRPLPLRDGLNPAHAAAVEALRRDAVAPILSERDQLAEADWRALLERLGPYDAWLAEQQGGAVAALGIDRLRAILASDGEKRLADLVAADKAYEPEVAAIENLERLVRYHRDLFRLCSNFVSFKEFYSGEEAIFLAGTLFLDQRACKLCLPVDDPARHAVMAGLAGAYLAYLDCVRPASGEKMQIVAAFTAGDSDNLMVGRNGVFYDRKGQDWDATITKIIDNPISVRQAFFSPYKKFVRLIEEQVAKRASTAEAATQKDLGDAAQTTANLDKAKVDASPKKLDIGTVAALGVAFGAIGSFVTAVVGYATGVLRLGFPATMGALLAIILVISMPSVIMAYLKLRRRNLGPILDANGWAINSRARINVPFGGTLTALPRLPSGARRDVRDPYAEKSFPVKTVLVLIALVYLAWSWYEGRLDHRLPESARSTHVLGDWAPRAAPVPPPAAPAP
jgi:hypothetical protein